LPTGFSEIRLITVTTVLLCVFFAAFSFTAQGPSWVHGNTVARHDANARSGARKVARPDRRVG
jgi:hypothetical protein